jgi:AraC family transcriptional regulator
LEQESFGTEGFPGTGASHLEAVERVIVAMRERVDNTLPLYAMAEIAHLSPYHFARTFRQVTGIPPGEFLGNLRLQRAKELLLTTDLSASEVCFEVGYASLGTFTTRFTQLVGGGVTGTHASADGGVERGPGRRCQRGEAADPAGA